MATRSPFLTTRFGGYYHRDVPQEVTALMHIGPGTPCGEYLRRFWQHMRTTGWKLAESYLEHPPLLNGS